MTDSHTRSKLFPDGFSATVPINCRRSEFLQLKQYYLSSEPNNKYHNCVKKQRSGENDDDWLVFLLSFGLQQTTNLNQISDLDNGNVLLLEAKLENSQHPFSFPKSICSNKEGIICVADTGNNRIVGFNIGGVQVFVFDQYEYNGQINTLWKPLSLCSLVNGNFVICNYGNRTINIMSHNGTNRIMFRTVSRPICVGSDYSGTIFILTESGNIEEFSRSGKTIRVTTVVNQSSRIYTIMSVSLLANEIYLAKYDSSEVGVFSKSGDRLRCLTLTVPGSGLNLFLSDLASTEDNGILASDHVNRSVHVFDATTGVYKTTLVNGRTGLGCVQAVCFTHDNILLTTEYSLNQRHCVKMFSCNRVPVSVDK